ncbi:MAG: ribose-phosphate pyrophosphokinase [Acidobacteria bacterium]|nr:MAG: ribose-phosphate pyrophosphokinase [Acidobacteriota bacterium]REJ98262.1 MAG: ribose-phosphate pyrophosphokinase [Acidobacteriota bacterium]REK17006.1 MAG: ribose-phosphate pyrophosphokinase [Acidobacteriota bacterium]REK42916.1 MAG: ribose-phosphate pyrophosphokinase [Acidobacteriota bacterium]
MKANSRIAVLPLPGNEFIAGRLAGLLGAETVDAELRLFPDGESYVRVLSDVEGKKVVLVCTLDRPNEKFLPLYFLSKCLRKQGAGHLSLVAPYLAYMRQDMVFNPGEIATSEYFGELISSAFDSLITVDPHLHRRTSLSEIYSIPNKVVHAADHIFRWIRRNVKTPVLIGPDSESEQWVGVVAQKANLPFTVLQKTRYGDSEVEVSVPEIADYQNHTPILIDDIISTARTMIETVTHLRTLGMKPAVCIGVHAVFADGALDGLLGSGIERIVTCNTIPHVTNDIDVSDLFVDFVSRSESAAE